MNKSDFVTQYYEFTKQASDLVRQYALGGIGTIWLLKTADNSAVILPEELYMPLALFSFALLFDLGQYLVVILKQHLFMKSKPNPSDSFDLPNNFDFWPNTFFWSKMVVLIIAYIYVLCFIFTR